MPCLSKHPSSLGCAWPGLPGAVLVVFAVIIGFAWLLGIENIVTRIVPGTAQWLPGQSIVVRWHPVASRA